MASNSSADKKISDYFPIDVLSRKVENPNIKFRIYWVDGAGFQLLTVNDGKPCITVEVVIPGVSVTFSDCEN